MDCRISSELMMKYLDGEACAEEKKLLFAHIEACEYCRAEFDALRDTFSLLDDVDMEEAPADLERNVICRIEAGRKKASSARKWLMVSGLIMAAWIGLTCIIIYTPFIYTLTACFSSFAGIINNITVFLSGIFSHGLIILSKMLALGRAFGAAAASVVESYGVILVVMILSMAVILKIYGNIYKSVRR